MMKFELPSFYFGFRSKSGECDWSRILTFLFLLPVLVICEVIITTAFLGYKPNQINFLLWDNIDFLFVYFRSEPLDTLKFVFIDKPLFVIESRQENPSIAIWGLHYYSYTFVAHVVVAVVLAQVIKPSQPIRSAPRYVAVIGSSLLILSSLYLYLSSCCTAGANWILHTWLLAIVFNPLTATEFIIEVYGLVNKWFVWLQILFAALGAYLVVRGLKRKVTV